MKEASIKSADNILFLQIRVARMYNRSRVIAVVVISPLLSSDNKCRHFVNFRGKPATSSTREFTICGSCESDFLVIHHHIQYVVAVLHRPFRLNASTTHLRARILRRLRARRSKEILRNSAPLMVDTSSTATLTKLNPRSRVSHSINFARSVTRRRSV